MTTGLTAGIKQHGIINHSNGNSGSVASAVDQPDQRLVLHEG